jgi:hypothetical protein
MTKLWLTYAWKDNEEEDVDHIVASLRQAGIDVGFDRAQLLAGQRLWTQIDTAIRDPGITGWAIYVTENSLRSEPCQEELAYALDRTLRTKGAEFPIIGLFPGNLDREIIPSAISTRLYVNLRANDWVQQVSDALAGTRSVVDLAPEPYGHTLYKMQTYYCLEVWPRTGTWTKPHSIVPERDAQKFTLMCANPRGLISGGGAMKMAGQFMSNGLFHRYIGDRVDAATSLHMMFDAVPSWVEFGSYNGSRYRIDFAPTSDLAISSIGQRIWKPVSR